MREIIYIAGYGRSGSTILDISLGQHDDIMGMGEFTNIFIEWENLRDDPFWSSIIKDFERDFDEKIAIKDLIKLNRYVQSKPLFFVSKVKQSIYCKAWNLILDSVYAKKPNVILVDSSKTTRLALFRVKRFRKFLNCKIKMIYLTRSFKSVKNSVKKGGNRSLEKNDPTFGKKSVKQFYFGYIFTFFSTKLCYPGIQTKLKFENFVANPTLHLNKVVASLGYNHVHYKEDDFMNMDAGNGISGNRARRSTQLNVTKQ
jgi:hypothetical protein